VGLKAAIVEQHECTRIAVEEILNRASDIDFVGGFTGVGPVLESNGDINVLLLDNGQCQPDIAAAINRLKNAHPTIHIIVLGRQWNEAGIRAALEGGADGVVDRDEPLHDLLAAGVRRVARGKQFLSPEVAALVYTGTGNNGQLTEREMDVVLLMKDYASTKEMAAALGVNRRTIYRIQQAICKKWNLRSKDQIVPEAIRRGIIRD
jgi:two-component system response regulator DesR